MPRWRGPQVNPFAKAQREAKPQKQTDLI